MFFESDSEIWVCELFFVLLRFDQKILQNDVIKFCL